MKISFATVYMVWTLVVTISLVASGAKILDKCETDNSINAYKFEDHWFQLGQLYSFCMQVCCKRIVDLILLQSSGSKAPLYLCLNTKYWLYISV